MCLAVPARVCELADDDGVPMAVVEMDGVRRTACLALVPEADTGDYVLVHAGVAIAVIDEAAAAETLELLAQAGTTSDGEPSP